MEESVAHNHEVAGSNPAPATHSVDTAGSVCTGGAAGWVVGSPERSPTSVTALTAVRRLTKRTLKEDLLAARNRRATCSCSSMEERAAVNRRTEDRYLPGALHAGLQEPGTSPVTRETVGSNPPRAGVFAPDLHGRQHNSRAVVQRSEHLCFRFRFLSA